MLNPSACNGVCLKIVSVKIMFSDLLLGIQKEADAGRLPKNVADGMEELYYNYRNAVN